MADANAVRELTQKLEDGVKEMFESGKYAEYLQAMSRFHTYSARNILLIYMQKPDATRVASYSAWKYKFNRQVKGGEHGLRIFAPAAIKKERDMVKIDPLTQQPIIGEDGEPLREKVEVNTARFVSVPVFDISQTVGEPLPVLAENLTGDVANYELFMDSLRSVSPLPIVFEPMAENQDGECRFGVEIALRVGMGEVQTVSAAIHELAHEKLHDIETLRLADENAEPKARRLEETEAESVAYVVCQYYGIDTGANSFGYLAEWSRGREMKELNASLNTIRKAAAELIDGIDERYRALAKERGIDLSVGVDAPKPSASGLYAKYCNIVAERSAQYAESSGTMNRTDETEARRGTDQIVKRVVDDMLMEPGGGAHYALYSEYMDNPDFKARLEDYVFVKAYLEPITAQRNAAKEPPEPKPSAKAHTHWLKIPATASALNEARQYKEIRDYLDRYPDSAATTYSYEYNLFDRVVRLDCCQNWNDLDLSANTMSHPLARLTRKPANIINPKPFKIPERLVRDIAHMDSAKESRSSSPTVPAIIADYARNAEVSAPRRTGTVILMTPVFDDGDFNRDGKKIRVTVEERIGKYEIFSRDEDGSKTLFFLTASGRIAEQYHFIQREWDYDLHRNVDTRPTEEGLDAATIQASERFDRAMADPAKWARYQDAAVVNRIDECDAHNAPVRLLREEESERPNEIPEVINEVQYSELQEKGFEYARKHTHLPLDEKLSIIAQSFGAKSASVFVQPCTGKYRGQSDIMLKLEDGGSMGIGMRANASARNDNTINDCVNNALARFNPETVTESKTRAAVALRAREAEDNANAEKRGLKPYKFLNVELCDGGVDGHTGWYFVSIAVGGKVFGFVASDLASDIERGVLTNNVSRANYFVAGGLQDIDVDFVFNNVGHSSFGTVYTVEMSGAARERAERTFAELSQTPSLTPDDKDFWRGEIANFLASNDGKMVLEDLDLPPTGNHGGLGKFYEVFGDNAYKKEFAEIVAQENTRRTGEPWIAFGFCEGGDYRPDFFKTPTAMLFAEADKFIRGYEPKVREILDGGYDKLDITVYIKRDDNEVHPLSNRYDIGDSKKASGFYNVFKAEADYFYAHPWRETSDEEKARDYADIAILKKAVTNEYPYVEVEKVIRYADGDMLDQKVFYDGEVLPFAEADSKIKAEEKAIRDKHMKKHGTPGDGDEELSIAVHFKFPGESEPSVFRFSYLLGDYSEEGSGLLKHFELGASYCNFCIKEGDYGNVNALLGGKTMEDAIRLAAEYTMTYETLRDSMAEPKVKPVIEQVAEIDVTMPDPTVSIAEMNEYGYAADENMLPMSSLRAVELFDTDHCIYLLYPNNTEAVAYERDEIRNHYGLCGIERYDWERSPVRAAQLSVAANAEGKREADFLYSTGNSFGIYQIRDGIDGARDFRFAPMRELETLGIIPTRENYELVYTAPFSERIEFLSDRYPVLNKIYQDFNVNQPADYAARSVSVSDVIALKYNGDVSSHFVDSAGFVELDSFLGEESRREAAKREAERTDPAFMQNSSTVQTEDERFDNDHIVDFAVSSPPMPTAAQSEADANANAGKAISLADYTKAAQAERKPPPKGKPPLLDTLERNKQKVARQGQPDMHKKDGLEV